MRSLFKFFKMFDDLLAYKEMDLDLNSVFIK